MELIVQPTDGIKPLIRYRTADLVRISPVVQGSPLPGPEIEVIGRSADRIPAPGAPARRIDAQES